MDDKGEACWVGCVCELSTPIESLIIESVLSTSSMAVVTDGALSSANQRLYTVFEIQAKAMSIAETTNTEIVSSGIGNKGVVLKERDSVKQNCLSYLILRCDKLKDIKKIRYFKLDQIYRKYMDHSINQEDICYISNLIDFAEQNFKEVSMRNLYFCYAVKYQLENLKKIYNYKIFDSFLKYLHEHATLTIKQFNVLMKYCSVKIKYYDYQSDE